MQSSKQTCVRLEQVGSRIRLARAGRWLLAGLAVCGALLLLMAGLDRFFRFGPVGRWTAFVITLVPLLSSVVMASYSWGRRLTLDAVARCVEKATPGGGGDNPLISVVQFHRLLPESSSFRKAVIGEIKDPFPRVKWGIVFNAAWLGRVALGLGAILLAATTWGVANPKTFGNAVSRLVLPGSPIAPLTFTKLAKLEPGDATVIHGSPISIRAELTGVIPKSVWLRYREEGGEWQQAPMKAEATKGAFNFEFPKVFTSFVYQVIASDLTTQQFRVRVNPRTAISKVRTIVTPPTYSLQNPTVIESGTVLPELLPGSKAALTLTFNNPVSKLRVAGSPKTACSQPAGDSQTWSFEASVSVPESLLLEFHDSAETVSTQTIEIRTTADAPPEITLETPPEGSTVVAKPGDLVDIRFKAADTVGIAKVSLMSEDPASGKMTPVHEFPDVAGKTTCAGAWSLPVPARTGGQDRLTYKLIVEDGNTISGPGTAASPAITISVTDVAGAAITETKAKDAALKGLDHLVELQESNLRATTAAKSRKDSAAAPALLTAQSGISDMMLSLCSGAQTISTAMRENLLGILRAEMPQVISSLRDAAASKSADVTARTLGSAETLESLILSKLKGTATAATGDLERKEAGATISALESLLFRQRDLYKLTKGAPPEKGPALSATQDEIAAAAGQVKGELLTSGKSASTGDEALRSRLLKVADLFDQDKITDNMFRAAEQLDSKDITTATATELSLIEKLSEMVKLLNDWQTAAATEEAKETTAAAEEMKSKLEVLATIQQAIVEKSKEFSRKNASSPQDLAVVAEIKELKTQIQQAAEQMVTDLHTFPDIPATEQLMVQLSEIVEKVEQNDEEKSEEGEVKVTTYDMEKEESILKDIEEAANAEGLDPQTETWVADINDPAKMQQEAYDANEFPEIPNVPLPETYQDTVSELLKNQEKVDNDDTATNKFSPTISGGFKGQEGDMATMSGMGQSGSEKPSHNEQSGRSSGGRSGMANGEMTGSTANNLEGDKADARRTKDSQQRGYVEDPSGMQETAATGGGKGSGFSDREGMEGDGVVQSAAAPEIAAANAKAAAQAQLAEKASTQAAKAEMFYINADGMKEVARLMDANAAALREGRTADSKGIHQQIVTRLRQMQGGLTSGTTVLDNKGSGSRPGADAITGGDEGRAPEGYRDQVADYFRRLSE